jgi:hypothetical protein
MTPKPLPPEQIKALPASVGISERYGSSTYRSQSGPSMISRLGKSLRRLFGK